MICERCPETKCVDLISAPARFKAEGELINKSEVEIARLAPIIFELTNDCPIARKAKQNR
jgi:hypothetical protein